MRREVSPPWQRRPICAIVPSAARHMPCTDERCAYRIALLAQPQNRRRSRANSVWQKKGLHHHIRTILNSYVRSLTLQVNSFVCNQRLLTRCDGSPKSNSRRASDAHAQLCDGQRQVIRSSDAQSDRSVECGGGGVVAGVRSKQTAQLAVRRGREPREWRKGLLR